MLELFESEDSYIFNNKIPLDRYCVNWFKSFFSSLTMHRDKPSLKEGMQDWLDTP
jgi:hypothetical protein